MEEKSNLRETGLDVIGTVPWGTHFCQFYETKQDLLDVLVPYFKEGLENNELCVWVTSEFLNTKEATAAMKAAIPSFSKYLKKGQIEIFPHTAWYLKGGRFEMKRVLADWVQKHDQALTKGFSGTRVSGNPFWIDNKKDWNDFATYEAAINRVIDQYKLVVLCTYSSKKCGFSEIIDVVQNHEFALIKQRGKWANIESAGHNKMEAALRHSEERFRSYIEMTEQLVWTTNARGEVKEDLPTWRKYTGQSFRQLKDSGWSKALHPGDVKRVVKVWKNAVSRKIPYEVEYRIRRYDGLYRYFLVRGVPVFSTDGNIHEWVGTCIDISDRKKAEEELVKRAEQMEDLNRFLKEESVKKEALLESIGDAIIALDEKKKIMALNKNTEPIFGWKTKDVLGKPLFSLFKLADETGKILPPNLRPPQLALATNQVIRGIYLLIKGKQNNLPLQITSAPVILEKKTIGVITVYKDISQQIAIDRAKDEFVSIASHELRTPLSTIAWSIEQLVEDERKLSNPQIKSLNRIYSQTQRIIKLTNDLLDATKMELGVFPYKLEEINPLDIASDAIIDLSSQIELKKIKFKTHFGKGINAYKTYSNALYMILHNLLSNAIKFTPKGGKISLSITKEEKEIIFQVSDSGLGIPKTAQDKIFQKAYRAGNVKGKFEGSGFGLYITKATIDRLGGSITVKSVKNKETVFTVILPLTQNNEESRLRSSTFDMIGQVNHL